MAVNPGYTRRQELRCTVADLATYSGVILYEGEVLYVKQTNGTYAIKIGDGVTNIANLPYVVNYADVSAKATAAANSATAAANSATAAGNKALDAEAWANGTRNGSAIGSGDAAYQKSSKDWADKAEEYKNQAATIAEETAESVLENKADVDGSYESMYSGYSGIANEARSLSTNVGVTDQTPLSEETAGGDSDIQTGYQNLNKLVGCKVVKNQHAKNPNFATDSAEWNALNATKSVTNGILTLTTTADIATGTYLQCYQYAHSLVGGHKILIIMRAKASVNCTLYARVGNTEGSPYGNLTANTWGNIRGIKTMDANNNEVNIYSADTALVTGSTVDVDYFYVIDLTIRYGSNEVVNAIIGSDSSKYVDNLLAFDPNILKDTDYDTGSFSECKSASLESVERNQFDLAKWLEDLGVTNPASVSSATFNGVRVWTNETNYTGRMYFYSNGITGDGTNGADYICQYTDGTNESMGRLEQNIAFVSNASKTVAYIRTRYSTTVTYNFTNAKVMVQYYWDGSQTDYVDFKKHSYPMPNVDLNGILKVVNGKVVADGDELTPDGIGNKKRYSVYNLGDASNLGTGYLPTLIIPLNSFSPAIHNGTDNTVAMPIACTRYRRVSRNAVDTNDKSIAIGNNNYLYIRDSAFTGKTAYEITEMLNGIYLIAPLAEEESLSADTFSRNVYMDDFGFISFLDEDGNVIDGLQGNEILYKANVSGFAESLYVRADGDPEFFAEAEDLTDEALNARGYYKMQDLLTMFGAGGMVGGTLRHTLAVKESLEFENTNCVELGSRTYNYEDANKRAYTTISDLKLTPGANVGNGLFTGRFKMVSANYFDSHTTEDGIACMNNTTHVLWLRLVNATSANDYVEAGKGILFAYEKAST